MSEQREVFVLAVALFDIFSVPYFSQQIRDLLVQHQLVELVHRYDIEHGALLEVSLHEVLLEEFLVVNTLNYSHTQFEQLAHDSLTLELEGLLF